MAYRSSSQLAGSNSATAAVPVPSAAASGDIAVVGIYKENTAAITPPAGFTQKAALTTSGTARGTLYVFWKRLTGADSGTYSFTWTGSTFRAAAAGLWSGRIATGDPFDGTVGTAESTSGVTTLNVSTSPAAANGDAVGFWTNFNGGGAFTAPTNYTERQEASGVITLDTRDAVTSGSTGNVTATCSITDFMKAFLGVLAVAGGSGATATPGVTPAVVALPQASAIGNATVTPALIAAVVSAPSSARNVGAGSGVLAAVVSMPQATPQAGGNATVSPAATVAAVTLPQNSPSGAGTAAPAVAASIVALPQASPVAGGGATASPSTVAAVASLSQASRLASSTVAPAGIQTAATLLTATPTVSDTATPGVISSIVAFLQGLVRTSATRTPAAISVVATLPLAEPSRIDVETPEEVTVTVRDYTSTATPRRYTTMAVPRSHLSTATARSDE